MDRELIASVVEEVMRRVASPESVNGHAAAAGLPLSGRFTDVDAAVDTATASQRALHAAGLEVRDKAVNVIKRLALDNAESWGKIEFDETKVGRLDHKVAKLELLQHVSGVEFIKAHGTTAHSGDDGIGLDESAPFGVIGVITPVTHSIPTMTANAINMIASGNTMVVNAHPSGAKCLAMAAEAYNKAVHAAIGVGPVICVMDPPTLETAEAIFSHPRIPLLVVTGGPAVARAALQQPKRAIVAGPGNPPVVVDETADLDNAARSIIAGAAFDNNLLCIGEKEVFVVESVMPAFVDAMKRAGAMQLSDGAFGKLSDVAFKWKDDHHVVDAQFVGKDPSVLGQAAGVNLPHGVELIFGVTDAANPFVPVEQMMPCLPIVPVRDFEQGLELSIEHEHGFGHTAMIHSNHLGHITEMGRAMNTTIFVVNGPCTGGLGIGGEGYPSYSIATPTGEGITSPLTFTRFRRNSVCGSLRIV
ncbi:MAG: aldehyde dehydrogenase [Planctomycetota bacterium]